MTPTSLRFQSTHPGWGATQIRLLWPPLRCQFQSTHPGWGATYDSMCRLAGADVSIHAPRVGCDLDIHELTKKEIKFQSTHPGWGATNTVDEQARAAIVSIHAPRVGCDKLRAENPVQYKFQSTHPGWGATVLCSDHANDLLVSIHAPRVGCDVCQGCPRFVCASFNPRTPGGVRLGKNLGSS